MARHDSALELAYSIELNLTLSEEARLQAKRDSMARWRKKHGKSGGNRASTGSARETHPYHDQPVPNRKPEPRTTPQASAEAARLRSTPSPEGRRKAQSLEMAHVNLARDWPQCDQCGAPRAADDGRGEPVVDHGNYLCRRCASKVGKAWFLEDPITESILRKQDDMPLYATAGVNGSGEEGNEDDGNYSNPAERPLYQKTGAWPDELWTNTDPKDVGKAGQEGLHDSETYYLNKGYNDLNRGGQNAQVETEQGKTTQHRRGGLGGGDDRGRGDRLGSAEDHPLRGDLGGQHRRRDHLDPAPVRGRRTSQDARPRSRRPGSEDSLVLGADPRCGYSSTRTPDHPLDDSQGRQVDRTALVRDQLRKMNDWYANGGTMDDTHWHGPAILDHNAHLHKHMDGDQGEHHQRDEDNQVGHTPNNPRSCIYCGRQNGHSLQCDRPANKAIDLSFLGPILHD